MIQIAFVLLISSASFSAFCMEKITVCVFSKCYSESNEQEGLGSSQQDIDMSFSARDTIAALKEHLQTHHNLSFANYEITPLSDFSWIRDNKNHPRKLDNRIEKLSIKEAISIHRTTRFAVLLKEKAQTTQQNESSN